MTHTHTPIPRDVLIDCIRNFLETYDAELWQALDFGDEQRAAEIMADVILSGLKDAQAKAGSDQ